MGFSRWLKIATLALLATCVSPVHIQAAVAPADQDVLSVNSQAQSSGMDSGWDTGGTSLNLVEKLRGFATVLLLIALVVAALVAGITGRTTMSIFVAVGAIVLYGGFWIVLLIIENLGNGANVTTNSVEVTTPVDKTTPIATIVKDFVGYGINMLTTATMPFAIIYGFWMSLGVATGESSSATGSLIRNYVVGAIVAIGASIFTQVFFRW